jgi:hypothetical protein
LDSRTAYFPIHLHISILSTLVPRNSWNSVLTSCCPLSTGSLFYLATIVRHFLLQLRCACGPSDEWAMLVQWTRRQEVRTDSCQMRRWPCSL